MADQDNATETQAPKGRGPLSDEIIKQIREDRAVANANGSPINSHKTLGDKFGVSPGVISHIVRNNTYTDPDYTPVFDGPNLSTAKREKTQEELDAIAAREAEKVAKAEARAKAKADKEAEKAAKAEARAQAKADKEAEKAAKAEAREKAKAEKAEAAAAKKAEREAAKEKREEEKRLAAEAKAAAQAEAEAATPE